MRARAAQSIDVLEGGQRQSLGDERPAAVDDVAHLANARRHGRRRDDPAAAKAGKSVRFGQAVRRDEHIAERGRRQRQRPVVVLRLCVDLVDQHPRADRLGHDADLLEHIASRHRAARVVRVRDHDQLRRRRQRGADDVRIERETLRPAALEVHDVRAGGTRRGDQRIVGRRFDQRIVAGLEQRQHAWKFAPDAPAAIETHSAVVP